MEWKKRRRKAERILHTRIRKKGRKNANQNDESSETRRNLHTHTHTHTHTGNFCRAKNFFLLIIATIFITQNIFGATIDLKWLDGATTINTNQCTFGNNTINIPTTAPKKTGYKFTGWKVMPECNLTNLVNIAPNADYFRKLDNSGCFGRTYTSDNYDSRVWETNDCSSDEKVKDLAVGEWKAKFSYGTVYGESSCNDVGWTKAVWDTNGKWNYSVENTRPADTFTKGVTGARCWCRVTGMVGTDGTRCNAASAAWVYVDSWAGYEKPNESCANQCTENCSSIIYSTNYLNKKAQAFFKTFDMSKYNADIRGTASYAYNYSLNNGFQCYRYYNVTATGNYTTQGENCSGYNDLTGTGSWKTEYKYGTIYGESSCNAKSGTYAVTTAQQGDISRNSSGANCWCRMTNFKPTGGEKSYITSYPWLYMYNYGSQSSCAPNCTNRCSIYMLLYSSFRKPMFNAVKQ